MRQHLAEREQADRRQAEMQAILELAQIRKQLQEQHGVYQVDLLTKVRTEREQDVERVWGDEG